MDPVVVVNATEGEPASWKDKVLLSRAPHLILDGAALAAHALGASAIVVATAAGDPGEATVRAAVNQRRLPMSARVVSVPHRFISGEGGALVRGINGETPVPPGIKVRASDGGVGGAPTLLSNAETYAQLAIAARLGARRYASVGTPDEPGTILLTVTGSAARPSVVECPTGTPLGEILWACGAPLGPGVLVGGFHGRWIAAHSAHAVPLSRVGLAGVAGTLGAGVVVPLGEGTCPLGETARVVQYLAEESAGQCGPCRLGLPNLAATMLALLFGAGDPAAVRAAAATVRGRGACHHPDGTADFAVSCLDVFADDVAAHRAGNGCGRPVRGILPLPRPVGAGSSRSLVGAGSWRLQVDWTRCEGHGLCAHVAPDLIQLDAHGFPTVPDSALPHDLESAGRRAVATCPALALRLADDSPGRQVT
jgi:NADH:ubiquinone oxidoreductase subunit F (NADH-binding)/ferredoxin